MKKQEYLDLPTEEITNEIWATQMMINVMNKTQLKNALHHMKQVYDAAYKTWARDLPFATMLECVAYAEKMVRTGHDGLED